MADNSFKTLGEEGVGRENGEAKREGRQRRKDCSTLSIGTELNMLKMVRKI